MRKYSSLTKKKNGGKMVLKLYYSKGTHTYVKKFRSYKDMDEYMIKLKKQGYTLLGSDIYK